MAHQPSSTSDVILYLLAIFIPPIPVFLKRGVHADLWINILLWVLGWIPGVLHAWYVISKYERPAMSTYRAAPVETVPPTTTTAPPMTSAYGTTGTAGTTTATAAPGARY
ncbi:hypothetical protein QBC47DRAFT_401737 [Echria macrotheca]|uniref:Uncharacterized protein n=1 Tax=Echria macrotheca TaxID=438768 RepID=A0AAJ0BGQ8_9PEZI|nr:hypothetical protein QBC47DRAFT_401737 [Echria macrotheca]